MSNECIYCGEHVVDCKCVKIAPKEPRDPHPWGEFLKIRLKVIAWMRNEMQYNDAKIAHALSMDETQVYLIRINHGLD